MTTISTPVTRYRFSVAEYIKMHESGIFTEDDRVELLDGEIHRMTPIGPLHAGLVNRLTALLVSQVGQTAIVSVQNPAILDDFSEPQPDLAVLRYRDDFYTSSTPKAADVLVLVEVSDQSLAYDRNQKLPRYAAAGIFEVWVVDASGKAVEQYTEPRGDCYRQRRVFQRGDVLVAQAIQGVQVRLDELFS